MKKGDYVWVVQCEGCLSTDSWCYTEGVFADVEGAKKCIEDNAFNTIDNVYQYVDFDDGFEEHNGFSFWEIRSKKYPDLYISYKFDKVLVQ